jgi:hypothetical protein
MRLEVIEIMQNIDSVIFIIVIPRVKIAFFLKMLSAKKKQKDKTNIDVDFGVRIN